MKEELTGIHVLIVEDTDDSRELLKMVLEYCGALVTTAAVRGAGCHHSGDLAASRDGYRHRYARRRAWRSFDT